MKKYEGSCLCGFVTYSFTGEIAGYNYCHCSGCRKASGTTYSTNAGVDITTFMLEDSKKYVKEYQSSPGTIRSFCSNCGSPLFSKVDRTPNMIRVRLGTLDTEMDMKAKAHIFVSEKASWHDITDDIQQFENFAL